MRMFLGIALCWLLAGSAVAQRGGGFRGGMSGGFRGGTGGFRPGFDQRFIGNRFFVGNRFNRAFVGYGGGIYPAYGFGFSYWPGYSDYPYNGAYAAYPAYQPSPNVTVIYPQQTQAVPATVYVQPDYQPDNRYSADGSPMYLIAFKDRVIRAAIAYWVEGKTLHYVTLQHEEKEVPMDMVDRNFSVQLNGEREVPFPLPAQ